jgi:hypothetical protein
MSRVIAAEAGPSISCTALTLAPAAMARLAAVWGSSCGVSPRSSTFSAAGYDKDAAGKSIDHSRNTYNLRYGGDDIGDDACQAGQELRCLDMPRSQE